MEESVAQHSTKKFAAVRWMDRMEDAFELMTELECRHLPVVDDSENIIGMLSFSDVQQAMMLDQDILSAGQIPHPMFHDQALVKHYMTLPIETIEESESISKAAKMMLEKDISSLVVSRGSLAVGIVTATDLLRMIATQKETSLQSIKENLTSIYFLSPVNSIAQTLANVGI